jgi:glutathione synthase
MHFLFIIDPLDTLNLSTDTSLLLIEEMTRRGHVASVAFLADLYLSEQEPGVRAQEITVDLTRTPFYRLTPPRDHAFTDFDLVLMRKDPPVDAEYLVATFVLEQAADKVPVVNDPVSLRLLNEKLLPLQFPQFAPSTLVSNQPERLQAFLDRHGRIVLKPLDDCSGRGIELIGQEGRDRIPGYVAALGHRHVMAQQFLAGVVAGDKRILLLDGEPLGAVNRVPRSTEHLANIHQGARVEATVLSARERDIVAAVRPLLLQRHIWLAGIDVIDGHLTEINITSPSATRQINQVSHTRLEVPMVDSLERLAMEGSVRP